MATIPVTILHGFLGSGKTTVLRSVLAQTQDADSVPSVVVNDMSELDVDGVLIMNTDVVNENNGNFMTISGDSVSSPEGVKKLHKALTKLVKKKQPPWILIETSGSSHPLPLVEYFKRQQHAYSLKGVITLVDSTWLRDDYDHAEDLIPTWQENLQKGIRGLENLLVEQIMFSNRVFLTKTDKLESESVKRIAQALHPLNPYANIIQTSWGNVGIEQFRDIENYNFFLVEQLSAELRDQVNAPLTLAGKHDQKIVAKVIKDDRPFHPVRLWQTCHSYLTKGVFRSKGFFWMPTRDDVSLLWSQANGNVGLEVVGFWRESVIHDESQDFTPEQRAILQEKIDAVESRFGDRRCRLTVIGQSDEADTFIEALNRCFLTDEELELWKNGGEFDDPWPKKVAKV
ncbi:CobW family GTP-binding protein [Vibrio nigripulchritudo]|uniref:CobW family GTP-binding protein n=1 Tax=Vibrio nigripulchritudo TaxID=28173 RepID=UPI0003B18C5D|nr:GTP-binding protein [Vibrio nigripulchritudo]CCN72375.1 putative Cobalamin (vitamin B12) biosynthesis CobW-like [Vibrio nigripulchritudo SFn118]